MGLTFREILFLLEPDVFLRVQLPEAELDVQDGESPAAAPHLDMFNHFQHRVEFSSESSRRIQEVKVFSSAASGPLSFFSSEPRERRC